MPTRFSCVTTCPAKAKNYTISQEIRKLELEKINTSPKRATAPITPPTRAEKTVYQI
jgi:hypothetical protein